MSDNAASMERSVPFLDIMGRSVRDRGLLSPGSLSGDVTILAVLTAALAALYLLLLRKRVAGIKDAVVLASGPFVFWYGARFLLFGVRWGVNSTYAMADPLLHAIAPPTRWASCPSDDPRECDLRFCSPGKAGAQPQIRVFSPILHYFSTFVQHDSAFIYAHLLFIVVAGVLWPLQVWGEFRKESYKRHRILGRVTLLSMALAMLTAAQYALLHLAGDTAAEKAAGLGFAMHILATCICVASGYAAARRGHICEHRQCMVRMMGLAYGVLPFKQMYVAALSLTPLPGPWTYAAAVWLATPTGMCLTEWAFASGKLPQHDALRGSANRGKRE